MFRRTYWRRWLIAGVPLVAICIFVGGYYALWNTFPFVEQADVATGILARGRSAPAVGTTTSASLSTPAVQHGRIVRGVIHSQILHRDMPYEVYLPPSYDGAAQRYPAIYMLHGSLGRYYDWQKAGEIDKTMDAMIAVGRLQPSIVIMPDGNVGMLQDAQWANNGDGTLRIEDYLVKEVIPFIDAQYHTMPNPTYRAIGGLSEGGYGAINIALHHPQLFGYVLDLSGDTTATLNTERQDLWAKYPKAKHYNSPIYEVKAVPQARSIHFCLIAGTSDVHTYRRTQEFAAVLTKLNIPYRTLYFPGSHSWTFWREHVVDALDYLNSVMPSASHKPLPKATT